MFLNWLSWALVGFGVSDVIGYARNADHERRIALYRFAPAHVAYGRSYAPSPQTTKQYTTNTCKQQRQTNTLYAPPVRAAMTCSAAKPRRATKEGQWVLRTPLHIISCFVSAQHGSKDPGFVPRPLSTYAIASLDFAY